MNNNNADKTNLKVDFMGIGTPKCGTEWIVACLKEHPEIDFSKHKEVNYFLSPTEGITNFVYKNIRIKNLEEYYNQFENLPNTKKGEYNNHYIFDKEALIKVKENFSDIKLILALRNPIQYLYSIFWYMKYSNAYDLLPETFEKAIHSNCKDDLFEKNHGLFGKYVKQLYEIFEPKQVLIIILEDIKNNPEKTMKKIYSHIGVNENFEAENLYKHINPTKMVRFTGLMKYIRKIINILEELGLQKLLNFLINTDTPIKYIYKKIFHSNQTGYPPINKETEAFLREYYKEDIKLLEKLISRDLSSWYKTFENK